MHSPSDHDGSGPEPHEHEPNGPQGDGEQARQEQPFAKLPPAESPLWEWIWKRFLRVE